MCLRSVRSLRERNIVSVPRQESPYLASVISITNFASASRGDTSGNRMALLAVSKRAVQGPRSPPPKKKKRERQRDSSTSRTRGILLREGNFIRNIAITVSKSDSTGLLFMRLIHTL
jgi:hypothetical protein